MATTYSQRQYAESDAVKKLREQMESQSAAKPAAYTSQWKPQIDSTVNEILNRKPFTYDVNGDELYQQYKDRYVNLGQQAMMDTMGQAAKLTGGYGNSNAQMLGQQAYQGYLQGLTDKIPELYQMAYDRYNQQGQDLYSKYGLLSEQDQAAYERWNNDYSRWLAERDYLSGRYDSERSYDYGAYRDSVADDQWKTQYDYGVQRDQVADKQWQQSFDYQKTQDQKAYDQWLQNFLYSQQRDQVSDQQWQAQFDEDLRRFNFANGLGEFAVAPVVVSGGGDSGSSSGSGGGGGGSSTKLSYEAAEVAKNYGVDEAVRYVNSQSNATKTEKQDAVKNAQGVAMTEHYKKLMESGFYKK